MIKKYQYDGGDHISNPTPEREYLEKKAEMLKVISHPLRLCILFNLLMNEESNVTNMQNCLNEAQSTISQHISKLKSAGLIKGQRNGTEIKYRIVDHELIDLLKLFFENNIHFKRMLK